MQMHLLKTHGSGAQHVVFVQVWDRGLFMAARYNECDAARDERAAWLMLNEAKREETGQLVDPSLTKVIDIKEISEKEYQQRRGYKVVH